ncbi:MAG: 30S ribosomal protein S14 [Thermoplasmatota archaeon]
MPLVTKERQHWKGIYGGCRSCGRKRGLVRRYSLNLCRQCFRANARDLGFKKHS